jgi:hypothetical protein
MAREEVGQEGLFAAEADADQGRGDLVAPYLQLLLAQGRVAAAGEVLGANDAVMVVYAAIRAADGAARRTH